MNDYYYMPEIPVTEGGLTKSIQALNEGLNSLDELRSMIPKEIEEVRKMTVEKAHLFSIEQLRESDPLEYHKLKLQYLCEKELKGPKADYRYEGFLAFKDKMEAYLGASQEKEATDYLIDSAKELVNNQKVITALKILRLYEEYVDDASFGYVRTLREKSPNISLEKTEILEVTDKDVLSLMKEQAYALEKLGEFQEYKNKCALIAIKAEEIGDYGLALEYYEIIGNNEKIQNMQKLIIDFLEKEQKSQFIKGQFDFYHSECDIRPAIRVYEKIGKTKKADELKQLLVTHIEERGICWDKDLYYLEIGDIVNASKMLKETAEELLSEHSRNPDDEMYLGGAVQDYRKFVKLLESHEGLVDKIK